MVAYKEKIIRKIDINLMKEKESRKNVCVHVLNILYLFHLLS